MSKTTYFIGLIIFSIMGIIGGLIGKNYLEETAKHKLLFKDIIEISAPTAFMCVTPTNNLEIDLNNYTKALQSKQMPGGRIVEKIGINNNKDHIYLIKYWIGSKEQDNIQEFKAIYLSKETIVPGNEKHFLVMDTIILSKNKPYTFCFEKKYSGKIDDSYESVALCVDANNNSIVEHLMFLKQKQKELNDERERIETERQASLIIANNKADLEAKKLQAELLMKQEEQREKLRLAASELKIKEKELTLAEEETRKKQEVIDNENKLIEKTIETKGLILATLQELNMSLEGIDELNVGKDYSDDNGNVMILISLITKNISELPKEKLDNVYSLKEYDEYADKVKQFNKLCVLSDKKQNKWNKYVASINDPKVKQQKEEEQRRSKYEAEQRRRISAARAEERKQKYLSLQRQELERQQQNFNIGVPKRIN